MIAHKPLFTIVLHSLSFAHDLCPISPKCLRQLAKISMQGENLRLAYPQPCFSQNATCADPAAEEFAYPVSFDVRDLISLQDAMDELKLGPNG